jgi:pre-60S factor REI1
MEVLPQLTSTTAPGKAFGNRSELADHYKSDWHKYNLKRREAGLPVLLESDFQARLEAAKSLRQDKQAGVNHLKPYKKKDKKGARIKEDQKQGDEEQMVLEETTQDSTAQAQQTSSELQEEKEEVVEIEPRQCLFDRHLSATVEANAERMWRKYGFFLPDREYLTDLEGMIGYCHEKIKLGHICLFCQRTFTTWQGCQKHMKDKRHCQIAYKANMDLEDLSCFYDFAEADAQFLGRRMPEEPAAFDDEEWEDISDDEEEMADEDGEEEEDVASYNYEDEVARMGLDVNSLGELIFPDGRIIGHRALRTYYKQRARPAESSSTAVVAAKRAAGERLYRGNVYNITADPNDDRALIQAGISPALAAGRSGKGILVGKDGQWNQVSIYRYRAAIRKERRGEEVGRRKQNRTQLNMNRMDKKANNLHSGVCVAKALR